MQSGFTQSRRLSPLAYLPAYLCVLASADGTDEF